MDHTLICIRHLRHIKEAKEAWAEVCGKQDATQPTWEDLVPRFLRDQPHCPIGGKYLIEPVGNKPRCTIHRPT